MEILKQGTHVVQLIPAHAHSGSAGYVSASTPYISMKGYHGGIFVADMGSITGAVTFKFRQAKDTSGTSQKALSIDGYYTDAAAVASSSITNDTFVYTAYSSGSSSQATGTTNNTLYVFPFQAAQLDATNSFDCVGVAAAAANAVFGVTAILYPRYEGQVPTVTKTN